MELVINFSGGKDSSAMLAYLCEQYPSVKKHVVMADTGWEHTDAVEWSRGIVDRFGLPLHVVSNPNKTFLSMVENRGKFPAPAQRQCTSDLKRDPINTWIRNNCGDLVFSCMGIRAEESVGRSRMPILCKDPRMTNGVRTMYRWNPILNWTEAQVRAYLAEREIPLHPVYQYLRRFSCRVCIFMNQHDLRQVKQYDPEAFATIAALEKKIGFTMQPGQSITERAA